MAFSIKLVANTADGSPWELDIPAWLEEPPPHGDLGWEDVSRDAGYSDYSAAISAGDLHTWHVRDRHKAFEGIYAYEGWRPIMESKVAALEAILDAVPEDWQFHLVRYEWESGLD